MLVLGLGTDGARNRCSFSITGVAFRGQSNRSKHEAESLFLLEKRHEHYWVEENHHELRRCRIRTREVLTSFEQMVMSGSTFPDYHFQNRRPFGKRIWFDWIGFISCIRGSHVRQLRLESLKLEMIHDSR